MDGGEPIIVISELFKCKIRIYEGRAFLQPKAFLMGYHLFFLIPFLGIYEDMLHSEKKRYSESTLYWKPKFFEKLKKQTYFFQKPKLILRK